MKNIFKIISVVLIVCLLTQPLCVNASSPINKDKLQTETVQNVRRMSPANDETYANTFGLSTSKYNQFKTLILNAINNFDESLVIDEYNIEVEQVYTLLDFIHYVDPMSFQVRQISRTAYEGSPYIYEIIFYYDYKKDEYREMVEKAKKVADDMIKDLQTDELTDVQKLLILHDRLADYCEYDYESYLLQNVPEISFSIYGALVNRVAVCDGYSQAYSYMLDMLGINNRRCTSENMDHSWNIVYLDGKQYHVDVTFDDLVPDIHGRVNHTYFLCSSFNSDFVYGHTPDGSVYSIDYDTTPNDTKYDNAFWVNSTSNIQYVNGKIYYLITNANASPQNQTLYELSGSSTTIKLADVNYRWPAPGNKYWKGTFARLASDDGHLFISTPTTVLEYDFDTGKLNTVYTLTNTAECNSIYGLSAKDGYLYIETAKSPNFDPEADDIQTITYKYEEYTPPTPPPVVDDTVYGDVNRDKYLNLQDVSALTQFLAGWQVATFDENYADIDGNGKINLRDAAHLAQYIAKWDVAVPFVKKDKDK